MYTYGMNAFEEVVGKQGMPEEGRRSPLKDFARADAEVKGEVSEKAVGVSLWVVGWQTTYDSRQCEREASDYRDALYGEDGLNDGVREATALSVFTPKEFLHACERVYRAKGFSFVPSGVVVEFDEDLHHMDFSKETLASESLTRAYLENSMRPFDTLAEGARDYARRVLHNGYDIPAWAEHEHDTLDALFVERVCAPLYEKAFAVDTPPNEETACAYACTELFDLTGEDYRALLDALYTYASNNDASVLATVLTPERMAEAVRKVSEEIDLEAVRDDYIDGDFTLMRGEQGESYTDMVKHLTRLHDVVRTLHPDTLRVYAEMRVREGVQGFKDEVFVDEDFRVWTERLLAPLIVSVSPNPAFQMHALAHGARAIPTSFSPEDMQEYAEFVYRLKASVPSVLRERLRRHKGAFYRAHRALLAQRAEETADTEQELALLGEILAREQERKGGGGEMVPLEVLDVACGTGRITHPLTKTYRMTGLDADAFFLAQAREGVSEGEVFLVGDVIDYKKIVAPEAYDAVLYTWHSLLEAYGVGNTLDTLTSAWHALREGGVVVFDMPTRENKGMEQGEYVYEEDGVRSYVAHIMDEKEVRFMLKLAGFTLERVVPWTTRPTSGYSEGMKKWTVVGRKSKGIRN
jgi:SAM-dependent methyltransferase